MQLVDFVGRKYGHFFHRYALGLKGDAYDLRAMANLQAAWSSARYYTEHLTGAVHFDWKDELLIDATRQAIVDGLYLEFGVAGGETIRTIAAQVKDKVYGFDSFKGLPEAWRSGFKRGAFAQNIPQVPANVELIVGLFEETLPIFVEQHHDPVSFMHVDCDLYSSTKTIFDYLRDRIVPGTIIAFDEYLNFLGWQLHEYRAFQQFVRDRSVAYSYVSLVPGHQQVCVRIDTLDA